MTASIGGALFPEHGGTVTDLLTRADAAMYRAKDQGRNRFHLYSPEEREIEQMHMRLKWKENILASLKDDRSTPWFQPIMGLSDNRVTHYEVLARMTDLDGSIVLPGPFIDIAETFGQVGLIERMIIEKSMKKQAEMMKKGVPLSFAMNLSGKDLGDTDLLDLIKVKINETGADPTTAARRARIRPARSTAIRAPA